MNNARIAIAALLLLIAGTVAACWYPNYEPQYYLMYNLSDGAESRAQRTDMVAIWQKLLPGADHREIRSLIYSDGYSVDDIRSLKLPATLNSVLLRDTALHRYVVLMRQVEQECNMTVDPWYFYYDNDPKLLKLDSLAKAAKSRITSRYGDRYAVQAARALKSLKRYGEIIELSQKHEFRDKELQAIFDGYLAGAFYHTENYDKALEIYRKSGDVTSLSWTLEKLQMESDGLTLAKELSMAQGNEAAIVGLLQSHIKDMEISNDNNSYWYGKPLSLPEIGDLISTARYAATNGLECYRPIWQYTEGVAYLINPVDYQRADSVFATIDLTKASPHLRDQVRILRFVTQCNNHFEPYYNYKRWLFREAMWLCEKGKEIIRTKPNQLDKQLQPYQMVFCRNTHQSYCYPLDMLHRAIDCIVVPKMLAAGDSVGALQMLFLADNIGLSADEIELVDSHDCASICFAMECGADIAFNALYPQHKLDDVGLWLSRAGFRDRWNDLIGTLLLAEGRYKEAEQFFDRVSDHYAKARSVPEYSTHRNPFAVQYLSDPWCRDKSTHMAAGQPYYKKWFARRMVSLQATMENAALPLSERAKAGVEYAAGMANSIYPCWSLTQYGVGANLFFPYQNPNQQNNRRSTEIVHDFMSEVYYTTDQPRGFDQSHQRLQKLRKKSERILREQIAMLQPDEAAAICEQMGHYLTIKHRYPNTEVARRLKSACDRWSDW